MFRFDVHLIHQMMYTRSRRASLSTQGQRKSVFPSPLSQSTSAINLSTPHNLVVHTPRKLSKRRTPTVDTIFPGPKERKAASLPATPAEPPGSLNPAVIPSSLPISMFPASTSKRDKRGSILDRLVKKFGMLRKANPDDELSSGKEDDWQHIGTLDAADGINRRRGFSVDIPYALRQTGSDAKSNVAPPRIDFLAGEPKPPAIPTDAADAEHSFTISFEAPFSIGRLTIANPDTPSSDDATPSPHKIAFSLDKSDVANNHNHAGSQPSSVPRTIPQEMEVQGSMSPRPPPVPMKELDSDVSTVGPAFVTKHSPNSEGPLPPEKGESKTSDRRTSVRSHPDRNASAQSPSIHEDKRSEFVRSTTSSKQPEDRVPRPSRKRPPAPPPPEKIRPVSMVPSIPFPASDSTGTTSYGTPILTPDRPQSSLFYNSSPYSAASILANPPTPCSSDIAATPLPEQPQLYDHSPFSTSSMLANPPTPFAPDGPQPLPPARPPHEKLGSDEPPSSKISRQTETFRLIRSPSGHVYSTNERIVAGGHQWELVGTSERNGRRSKDRDSNERSSRDRRSSERRERRQESRSQAELDNDTDYHRRSRSQWNEKMSSGDRGSMPLTSPPSPHDRLGSGSVRRPRESRKSTRRIDDERDRTSERKVPESSSLNINKPQPPPPPPSTNGSPPLERRPSLSVRPTSQLPSAAEMTALRAKEAWDMERLWKARSINGDEPNGYATFPSLSGSSTTEDNDDSGFRRAVHGSSHTAFVVQATPFQPQHSIYHSMPTAPPPIIYSPIPSLPQTMTSTHHQPKRRPYSSSIASNPKSLASSVTNPLPEPPRESPYEPAPLPLPGSYGRSSDYWARLAGVATSR